jgi:hypothetical protein
MVAIAALRCNALRKSEAWQTLNRGFALRRQTVTQAR